MLAIRRLLAQRSAATLLCVAALMLKLLVPTGYMIGSDGGRVTMEWCSGFASTTTDMPTMHRDVPSDDRSRDHGKGEMPCAFSGLSAAALSAVDPVQLAALVAFVVAIGVLPTAPPAGVSPTYLRPPLRGPPTAF